MTSTPARPARGGGARWRRFLCWLVGHYDAILIRDGYAIGACLRCERELWRHPLSEFPA